MTISSFFESALGAFDIQDQIEKFAALRATFEPVGWAQKFAVDAAGQTRNPRIFLYIVNGLPDLEKLKS